MDTTGQEVGKIETRLRQLGTKLDRLTAKAAEAGADAKLDYHKQIELIRDKHSVVRSKLAAFRAANGQKWDNFKGGVETAWHDLENAFRALKQDTSSPPGVASHGDPLAEPANARPSSDKEPI
jgi:hypothetical protein